MFRVPSVVTIQAPAGIGKSSMLKYIQIVFPTSFSYKYVIKIRYMCLKWSAHELWSENFEILIFIECRTLNYIGPMTCRFFTRTKIFVTQIMIYQTKRLLLATH